MYIRILAHLVLLLISSSACASIQAAQKLSVMLDWKVNPNHAAIIVAQQQGFFKEEGVSVKLFEPLDPLMPAKWVATNKYDLAVMHGDEFIVNQSKHLPLIKTATLISTPLHCILTLKTSGIKTLDDLQGKNLGYAFPHTRGSFDLMLHTSSKPIKDIKKIYLGTDPIQALLKKEVDAITSNYRHFDKHQIRLQGHDVVLFYPEEHGVPSHDELILVANSSYLQSSAIHAFNRALTRSVAYMVNYPDQAWKSFISYNSKKLNTVVYQSAWNETIARFAHRPSATDFHRYKQYADFLQQKGFITKKPSFKQAFLPSQR
tara:strand:- start:10573 stop:11523 length:951 start_codon:yes stop_codon:yes gene_type:complete